MGEGVRDDGAAAVEFALIALLLLTIVFGGIEGGRLWLLQSTLAAGARDAAREVAINHHSLDDDELAEAAQAAVASAFNAVSSDPATAVITHDCSSGGDAEVEATAEVGTMTGLFDGIFGGAVPLQGVGVMRCNG